MKNEIVRQHLLAKWSIRVEKMWLPLIGRVSADTMSFEFDEFEQQFGVAHLQHLLREMGEHAWWAISEVGEDRDGASASLKSFTQQGQVEMYYCNATADWVVYVSHENTVSLGGAVLLDHLQRAWPDYVSYCNPWE